MLFLRYSWSYRFPFCFISQSPAEFARLYRDNGLHGGHVIKLGPRNDEAAKQALGAWPGTSRPALFPGKPIFTT